MIGDDIEIVVIEICGSKVRLGVAATKDVPVHRREIYDAIRRENRLGPRASRIAEEIPAAHQEADEDRGALMDVTERPDRFDQEQP